MRTIFRKVLVYIITIESRLILWRHQPYIIAVTGNVGKTTVKDIIAQSLEHLNTRATKKSQNSEIGVPLTIIDSVNPWYNPIKWIGVILKGFVVFVKSDYPDYLVLEVGADAPNDIKNITTWLSPNVSVLTEFAEVPVHIENFNNDRNLLIKEKAYLVHAAKDLIVYCGDDIDSQGIIKEITSNKIVRNKDIEILSYGVNKFNDIVLEDVGAMKGLLGMRGSVKFEDRSYKLEIKNVLGEAAAKNCLPAVLIGNYLEESIEDVIGNLVNFKFPNGRMKVLKGIKGSYIIDDTYNASPKAMMNALYQLKTLAGRKIAVLGDMLELGIASEDQHKIIGAMTPSVCDILITVGVRSRVIAESAMNSGMKEGWILECDNSKIAGQELKGIIKSGDVILVKGSQGMRMEKVVEQVLEDGVDMSELVRQEKEWKIK